MTWRGGRGGRGVAMPSLGWTVILPVSTGATFSHFFLEDHTVPKGEVDSEAATVDVGFALRFVEEMFTILTMRFRNRLVWLVMCLLPVVLTV